MAIVSAVRQGAHLGSPTDGLFSRPAQGLVFGPEWVLESVTGPGCTLDNDGGIFLIVFMSALFYDATGMRPRRTDSI